MKKTVKKKTVRKVSPAVKKTAAEKTPLRKTVQPVKKSKAASPAAKAEAEKRLPLWSRIAAWIAGVFAALVLLLGIAVYFSTYHPDDVQSEQVFNGANAPVLKAGQNVKVLSWNVQFMSGKNYVFFFDTANSDGQDLRPSSKDIGITIAEVARIIKAEKPDIILLQEVDGNAKRTDYQDQLARLMTLLPKEYSSYTSSWYWKAAFLPHPKIMGRVGVKLGVISKYKMKDAIRYQLPLMPDNIVFQQLNFKRAILEARFPVEGGKDFSAFCTHLDAFAQGNNTMELQVALLTSILKKRSDEGAYWVAGGDYNLLAPGRSYKDLPVHQRVYYKPESELAPLFEKYSAVPSPKEVNGPDRKKWFTHFPNDPLVKGPDRTIDFIFMSSNLKSGKHYIRQSDTIRISDHMPVVSVVTIKK